MSNTPNLVITPTQLKFDLQIATEQEVNGIGMGVLSDGNPFLTIRGLAQMCGVDQSGIVRCSAEWQSTPVKPRIKKLKELIIAQGANPEICFIAVKKNGQIYHAIPDAVCMAFLEYYAFDKNVEHALQSYRILARKGFRDFIYSQTGYNPEVAVSNAWRQFHDRVSLTYHTVPDGYFSIFKELSDMMVTLIRAGAELGQSFIPDISVGIIWANYWKAENLDIIYGERKQYGHNYPNYFPQSLSNPQSAYCYPDEALGEFRKWLRTKYLPQNFSNYLNKQVKSGQIAAPKAHAAIEALVPKSLQ